MKNFSFSAATRSALYLCLFLTISGSLHAEIIYQHNFDNLDNPPTKAQLGNPKIIYPGFTTNWTISGAFLGRSDGNGGKALGLGGQANTGLFLTLPACKVMDITTFSFRIKAPGTGNTVRITINGALYGDVVKIHEDGFINVTQSSVKANLSDIVTIGINVIYGHNTDIAAIDDLTIHGNVMDRSFKPESLIYPPAQTITERCQGDFYGNYGTIVNEPYTALSYSVDVNSGAAGVSVSNTGLVNFPYQFNGETTVTANLTACNNESIFKSYTVHTEPGGIPMSDMDFQASYRSGGTCPDDKCGYMDNGCYRAGYLWYGSIYGSQVNVKVRFKDNVRNFEIIGRTNVCSLYGFSLYFSQSDFNNYKGALKLPTHSFDYKGISNLRLLIFSDNIRDQDHAKLVKATASQMGGYWRVQYFVPSGDCWIANKTTTIYLADAGTSLPVKLESITAKATPEGNHITWKTTEEINFSHFEIEKSDDPRQGFQYLAAVSSAKNQYGSTYQYTDVPSSALMQYYRLKMVDFDGSFEHSKIVTAGGQLQEDELLVYPNPAQNHIFLQSPDAVKSVRLVDQKGNEVFSRSFLNEGKSFGIPLPKLNAGAYYLKVNEGAENQQVRKVLIR